MGFSDRLYSIPKISCGIELEAVSCKRLRKLHFISNVTYFFVPLSISVEPPETHEVPGSKGKDLTLFGPSPAWEKQPTSWAQLRDDWVRNPKTSRGSVCPFLNWRVVTPKAYLRAVLFKARPPFPKYKHGARVHHTYTLHLPKHEFCNLSRVAYPILHWRHISLSLTSKMTC